MENPRAINRFLFALLGAFTAAVVGISIYCRQLSMLLGWFATIGLFFIVSAVLGLLNVVVFAPVFWMMGKFTGKAPRWRRFGGR